jgi:hypothetical protein
MNTAVKNGLTLLATVTALLGTPALKAQSLVFNVNINTALLSAEDGANAPFYLDFQDNYGVSPEPSNTTTLSNFQFTGGSAVGSATTSGTASGSLAGSVSLTASASSPSNELYQEFSSGTTDIQFTATVAEAGPVVNSTPTEFTTAILDSSLGAGSPAELYTTAGDTQSLVTLNLSPSNTVANVGAYSSTNSADDGTVVAGVSASVSAIPEPSTTAAIAGGAALMLAFLARRFGGLQTA